MSKALLAVCLVACSSSPPAAPYQQTELAPDFACDKVDEVLRGLPRDDLPRLPYLVHAGDCLAAAGRSKEAIAVWKEMVSRYENKPGAPLALAKLAPAYEQSGMLREAADAYVLHVRYAPDDEGQRARLARAICLYQKLGDAVHHDQTLAMHEKLFGRPSDACP